MNVSNPLPLLLLDNSSTMTVLNQGEFKCHNLTFEEAKHIIEVYEDADILRCFNNSDIETVIFDYLGVAKRDAIVFKLYITPSETQPIIQADDGVEAKKIQNVYVFCQHIMRIS